MAELISKIIDIIVSVLVDWRKQRQEEKKEKKKEERNTFQDRPELKIAKYKNYLNRPGYGVKKECDINVFITRIENVSVEDDVVAAHYNDKFFNEKEWCCVIYEFKNVGKTDILCIRPVCTYKKDTMLCSVDVAKTVLEYGIFSCSTLFDKKIRVGESFSMKVCYHKDCKIKGSLTAFMIMDAEDSNNRFWEQPLFAPENKIYDAYSITRKEYKDNFSTDMIIESIRRSVNR